VGSDHISFVVIDVPQAVDLIEGTGGQLLEQAGYQYDVVRVAVGTADMTTQMQGVADSGAGVVQVIGNDAFCIAAFQGLEAVGYEGETTAITQCITDATREAMPGGLEGINVFSTLALGDTEDETYQLYLAVMDAFGSEVEDVDNFMGMGGYAAMASLLTAAEGIDTEDVSRESLLEAIRGMDESEYPGGGGIVFQCDGTADPEYPPFCTNQWLRSQLDADGNPTEYTVENSSDLMGD
jgi:branched-chain amino acid transport system substrate-binding protein